ncbi:MULTISPECIES: hypothetical protein [unclassified Anaerobiospirillum]|uniref:hypothetical protein n=1 Tax=unclassified Anaerobiospirillum TaxID=2647410 RepID=UPI001FF62D3C|nr:MULTISPECIES: hypothetical protein [unclassified Anaerobiospirillum]MCK0534000.1 hypothetical protein [Anaerobiospirillum sp. NML120511]MCK0539257.1 hypothetical protein [Anaerobiospirillum sp. NML02-A-032]
MDQKLLVTIDTTNFVAVGYGNDRVYKMAEQFIKSLALSSVPEEQINYLARPVLHSDEVTIDWKIPFDSTKSDGSYSIVKWTSATPAERADALQKIREFERNLHTYSKEAWRTKEDTLFVNFLIGEQSSRKLNAIHFPGKEYVYIVDGKPVITMWGFLKDSNDPAVLPSSRLQEEIPKFTGGASFTPPPPPSAPAPEPAPFSPPPEPPRQEPQPAPVEQGNACTRHRCCAPFIAGGIFAGHTLCWVIFFLLLLLLLIPLLIWLLWKYFGLFAGLLNPLFGAPDLPVPDLNPPAVEAPAVDLSAPDLPAADLTAPDLPSVDLPAVDLPEVNVNGNGPSMSLSGGDGGMPAGNGMDAGNMPMGGGMPAGSGASGAAGGAGASGAAGGAGASGAADGSGAAGTADTGGAAGASDAGQSGPLPPPDPQMPAQQSPQAAVEAARAAERQAAIDAARAAEEQALNPNAPARPVAPPDPVMPAGTKGLSFSSKDLQNQGVSVLNGDWNTRSPLMDSANGKPLQMAYKFNDGKGEITVTRPNGAKCTAPISAAVKGKDIVIENGGKAVCPDNSTYQLPQVKCTPDASGKVSCTGQNGNQRFPITLYSRQ